MKINIKKINGLARRPMAEGFIALTSAIIMSAILLMVAATGSLSGFFTRSTVLDAEYKERSLALADACIDTALVRLAGDFDYTGGETVEVDGAGHCQILPGAVGKPRVFHIEVMFRHAYTDISVGIDVGALTLVSYTEVSHF